MKDAPEKPDVEKVLSGLKDFQRRTVDTVFQRLYKDKDPAYRFLIADEVGLGKTMVARGLIAKAIEELWDTVGRIDVVYICSSREIAKQNIDRLNIFGRQDFALPDRITELPKYVHGLKDQKLNFVAFTPGTSFNLKSSTGTARERALLYRLLKDHWELSGVVPLNVLQCGCGKDSFRSYCDYACSDEVKVDADITERFLAEVDKDSEKSRREGKAGLRERFETLYENFSRSNNKVPAEIWYTRNGVIGDLRTLLAAVCLEALEPDLIILDEFQRFKDLLEGDSDAAQLASKLFDFSYEHVDAGARVILLSATPYKMYTLHQESGVDDHYGDFLGTLKFLFGNDDAVSVFHDHLSAYQQALLMPEGPDLDALLGIKTQLENCLRQVMVRTERLGATPDRDGMLKQVTHQTGAPGSNDLSAFLELEQIARALGQRSILEYWKSAPFLLNFMDEYALKRDFNRALIREQDAELHRALAQSGSAWLPRAEMLQFAQLDPANAKLRILLQDTVEQGWRRLWVPPSLPYYPLGEPFIGGGAETKRLVFSCWKVVPKVIAAIGSYEAERRAMRFQDPDALNTPEEREKRRPLLRFALSNGRLTGLNALGLIVPSFRLAEATDPLKYRRRFSQGEEPSFSDMRDEMSMQVEGLLARMRHIQDEEAPVDERWLWAAPLLFESIGKEDELRAWLGQADLAEVWRRWNPVRGEDNEDGRWGDHVEELRQTVLGVLDGEMKMGNHPCELVEALVDIGLGGFGNCALRTLQLQDEESEANPVALRNAAAGLGFGALRYVNTPESIAVIRGEDRHIPYWQKVAHYNIAGCLQSVLDEYAHTLCDAKGLAEKAADQRLELLAEAMSVALGLRTTQVSADHVVQDDSKQWTKEAERLRLHYALRFGSEREEEGEGKSRAEQVRAAFNSPFRPFVLATTSVGQEGLDFHTYCHAVVHWNLPSNPVDFEQREGRVHRYKGHAVRKNAARRFGDAAYRSFGHDPWKAIFTDASAARAKGESELTPFWILPDPEGSHIERHVYNLPLSREVEAYERLQSALAAYRMVFGQSRQEDLMAYLLKQVPADKIRELTDTLRINLEPRIPLKPLKEDAILAAAALRVDGYKMLEETGIPKERIRELTVKYQAGDSSFDATDEEKLATFFYLQRYLCKWGGELISCDRPEWRAYRQLFLECVELRIPEAFKRNFGWWEDEGYADRVRECVQTVQQIHLTIQYQEWPEEEI
jgi:hypothetical protein